MTTDASLPRSCPRCGTRLADSVSEGLCPRCLLEMNLGPATILTSSEVIPTERPEPPSPEQIAPLFPQFEILEYLGRGGMGVVYKARQKSLDRLVALKILAPEREREPDFAMRFAREAQALARLSHPNIVTVYDFGEVKNERGEGLFYLLMEFVDGVNVRQLLRTRRLEPKEALAIVPSICDALQYAHDRGIVHRDIKPENLLLNKRGGVKIADFGIAKMLGVEVLEKERRAGTPEYMAPEQRDAAENADHRADIYSLGVVLYEMLTGELPAKQIEPPSRRVQVDVRLDEVVLRALEESPERRYQTASDMRAGLDASTSVPTAFGLWHRKAIVWTAAVALVLVLGTIGWGVASRYLPFGKAERLNPEAAIYAQQKLRAEIEDRLNQAGWTVDGLSVTVSSNLKRAICVFRTAWRDPEDKFVDPVGIRAGQVFGPAWEGKRLPAKKRLVQVPEGASIRIQPQGDGIWIVEGEGAFAFLRFTVSVQGEMKPAHADARDLGEMKELVINDDSARADQFVDLDTGRLFSPPPGISPSKRSEMLEWVRITGIDAMGETNVSVHGLVGFEIVAIPIPSKRWEQITFADLQSDDALNQGTLGAPVVLSAKGALPETFLFKTRDGGRGVLQITGFAEDPRGVKIRYRLASKVVENAPNRETDNVADTGVAKSSGE